MKSARWVGEYIFIVILMLSVIVIGVVYYDPFFHYHSPNDKFYYYLNNERSQNDGIIKHFDYDAIITGTSMAENFKVSETNKLFGVNAIKVCFAGGTYKEINDNLEKAFKYNSKIRVVIRGLDSGYLLDDKNKVRNDLGEYPVYLYDDNIWNDVYYWFNRDIIFNWCLPAYRNCLAGDTGGITDFDEYSNWMTDAEFGTDVVMKDYSFCAKSQTSKCLTKEEKEVIRENVNQNIVSLAQEHPQTTFYYFFTPYSVAWYVELYQKGELEQQLEAEEYAISLILSCDNIKLFSFNNERITANLNNYKDKTHYGEWINSYILENIRADRGRLTKDNYMDYLKDELKLYYEYSILLTSE